MGVGERCHQDCREGHAGRGHCQRLSETGQGGSGMEAEGGLGLAPPSLCRSHGTQLPTVSVHTPQGRASAGLGELEPLPSLLWGPTGAGMWVSGSCASCLPQGLLWVGAAFQFGGSGDLFPRIQAKRPGQLLGVLPAGDPAP